MRFLKSVLFIIFISHVVVYFTSADFNFVFVLTDDQDLLLKGMSPMKNAVKLIGNQGKTFSNAFVNSPICCPNRGTILTGKYPHNHGIVNNSLAGNCSSKNWQVNHEPFSVASILKSKKNYTTFYGGKYLNQYGSPQTGGTTHVPKGYDWWVGLKGNSKYYNYTLSLNGTAKFFQDQYLTDVLAIYGLDFLNQKHIVESPFFMVLAPPASHAPFTPAKRHMQKFNKERAIRTPSFNFSSTDKHWLIQMPPKNLPQNVEILDDIQRNRLRSLLSVDEMIASIYKKLKQLQILHKTYIIYSSDNGFHIGQFSQPWDKRQPYQTDVRVPLLFSGPNIPTKSLESYPVSSVDLTPTILDLAGVQIPKNLDGKSLKNILFSDKDRKHFRKRIFIEYFGEGDSSKIDKNCPWTFDQNLSECSCDQWCKCQDSRNNTYSCVIDFFENQEIKFCQFKDNLKFSEVYNVTNDYYELKNVYTDLEKNLTEKYVKLLKDFENCSGLDCHII